MHFNETAKLAIGLPNSLARKNLSITLALLLSGDADKNKKARIVLDFAKGKLDFAKIFHASNAHGAALLSGYVLEVLLDRASFQDPNLLDLVREVLGLLGQGVIHSDQYVSIACALGLETALTARPHDKLMEEIATVLPKVLVNLTDMVKVREWKSRGIDQDMLVLLKRSEERAPARRENSILTKWTEFVSFHSPPLLGASFLARNEPEVCHRTYPLCSSFARCSASETANTTTRQESQASRGHAAPFCPVRRLYELTWTC